MSILNNIDLNILCENLNIKFVNIISKDMLNNHFKEKFNNGIFIVNLNNSNQKGSHWVAIYNNCYFDSYGFVAPIEIENYFSKIKKYLYNDEQLQDLNDTYCGWFCLYFLYWMINNNQYDEKKRYKEFFKLFDREKLKNNKYIVFKFFDNIVNDRKNILSTFNNIYDKNN